MLSMRMRISTLPALLVLLSLAGSPVLADELLRFKSGYEMMVVSHREQGTMVIVTLDGGGEVGFPKDSLVLLEGGKATTRTGPSPLFNKVPSRVSNKQFMTPIAQLMPSRFLAKGAASPNGTTVGYSKGGKGQQRFSGGPLEMVNPNGKIGVDIRQISRMRNYNNATPADSAEETSAVKPRTINALLPNSKE